MTKSNSSPALSTIIVIVLGAFLTPMMGSSVNIALPAIADDFGMKAVMLGWIPTSFLLAAGICLLPAGRLADIYGKRIVFIAGAVVYTLASCASAMAPGPNLLLASRVIHGIAAAMLFGTTTAIATLMFTPEKRGMVLGITVSATYLGLTTGPIIGGLLTQHLGWRSIFWVHAPFGLLMATAALSGIAREGQGAHHERFDMAGAICNGIALFLLMFGFSRFPHAAGFAFASAGIIMTALFVILELRTGSPLIDMRLFQRNLVFRYSNAAAFINYSATFAVGFIFSLYLQYVKGLSPRTAGMVLIAQPAVMALLSPIAGRLSDRIEPRIVASIGMAVTTVALLMMTQLSGVTGYAWITGSLGVLGLGIALFSSPNTNAVMSAVDRPSYGIASATIGTMRLLGQMFSMGLAMLVIGLYLGDVAVTVANRLIFVTCARMTAGILAAFCFAGIFASLARGKMRRPD